MLGGKSASNQKKYGTPLPVLLPSSPLLSPSRNTFLGSYIPSLLSRERIEIPQCVGVYDATTRSVWVTRRDHIDILFRRGFFGKGTLSRSEPTWRERRLGDLKSGDGLTAEQVREKRRIERKQFKIDRAAAMLSAAKAAEAVLTSGQTPSLEAISEDGSSGGVDLTTLTPQTFLVRPTRPDTNRNRGRKAFKRTPKPPLPADAPQPTPSSLAPINPGVEIVDLGPDEQQDEEDEEDLAEELVEDMEHLQLALEEAWFLASALGVLKIYDPLTNTYPPPSAILPLFLTPFSPGLHPVVPLPVRPDDPFLVSYVAYHHFRSLGWVVKPGIKFACDWLLYRRGPAFSHSAFSCVVIPVYSDLEEQAESPYGKEDWYVERCSWKWMNTIMRVNSLVQKTVILVYVTIPSTSAFPPSTQLSGGGLDWRKINMSGILSRYTVREAALTRFSPARRRD
ncbi:hypothetical protein TREMEDRAFT_25866 [Tremella mesenterica DSM 1558]|uniref:uncharacterized protein n=1 Tax=Tremella mesenterica (strain ATCC 24925 / CBS 8224 / DSM 1558 / NBRC 9311 / NRRL Y-6157 / RJB 2259-6 / UBC 559-6) TaxID=578456 RepID=UPI0003F48E2C|nr:uncharacterized protein TREMEDRAFT_25866 [Tremella mesenterica DSM 1558]EIW72842.1 hypothetical protein TREMEDRAFT_25866 [Tremella mesenterica DSM 1558]